LTLTLVKVNQKGWGTPVRISVVFSKNIEENTRLYSFIFNGEIYHEDNF